LTARGQAAWTSASGDQSWDEENQRARGPFIYHVETLDSHGRHRLIDSGTDVDPNSLELHGQTITWTRNGEAHKLVLP
jgi:hypothetical protein